MTKAHGRYYFFSVGNTENARYCIQNFKKFGLKCVSSFNDCGTAGNVTLLTALTLQALYLYTLAIRLALEFLGIELRFSISKVDRVNGSNLVLLFYFKIVT